MTTPELDLLRQALEFLEEYNDRGLSNYEGSNFEWKSDALMSLILQIKSTLKEPTK
jgi:hypothetical protein